MRAPSAKRFRRRYAKNLGLAWLYPTRKEQQQQRLLNKQHAHRIVLYCKTGGSNGAVWPHLCSYVPVLKLAFPEAEVADTGIWWVMNVCFVEVLQVFCVVLDNMAVDIQVLPLLLERSVLLIACSYPSSRRQPCT